MDIRPHVCGAYFTDDFSIVIKIWWQIWFPLVQILINWSLQNFVHSMTSTLSRLVWKRVVILRDDITAKRIHRIWITKNISCQRNVIQGRYTLVFWKLICVATLMSNMICFREFWYVALLSGPVLNNDMIQWNLSVTTTSMIKSITCDLFSNVF